MRTKRNHYVPQFYLNYFLPEGEDSFWVYDKEGGEPRRQQPKDTAVIGHFYTFQTPDGERDNLEKEFSQLEASAKPILDRWQTPKALPELQEIEIITAFLAFQNTRVPRAVETVREMGRALLLEELRQLAKYPEEARRIWEKHIEGAGKAEIMPLEWFQAILTDPLEEGFEIGLNEKYALGKSLEGAENIAPYLLDRNWYLCTAPDRAFFLTSDTPVSVFESNRNRAWSWGGFGLKNAEVAFPISPKVCLLLSYRHTQKRWRVNERFVEKINLTTVTVAERFIISPLDTKRIRQLVARSSGTRAMTKVDYERLRQLERLLEELKPKK